MDPNINFLQSLRGFQDLYHCLRTNAYPETFLKNVLGLTESSMAALPQRLAIWIAVYLVCGLITVLLRQIRQQRSLSTGSRMVNNVILIAANFFFVPQLRVFWEMCRISLAGVTPWAGTAQDFVRWFSEAWTSIFTPLFMFLVILLTAVLPLQSALHYLKVYKLFGVPHMIFDVGTGLYLLSVVLLAAAKGERRLYLLILPAVIMLCMIQRGGAIREERRTQAAMDKINSKS